MLSAAKRVSSRLPPLHYIYLAGLGLDVYANYEITSPLPGESSLTIVEPLEGPSTKNPVAKKTPNNNGSSLSDVLSSVEFNLSDVRPPLEMINSFASFSPNQRSPPGPDLPTTSININTKNAQAIRATNQQFNLWKDRVVDPLCQSIEYIGRFEGFMDDPVMINWLCRQGGVIRKKSEGLSNNGTTVYNPYNISWPSNSQPHKYTGKKIPVRSERVSGCSHPQGHSAGHFRSRLGIAPHCLCR